MAGADDRSALLATHIDPGWGGSSAYREAVDRYIAEEGYDDFVCVSRQEERFSKGGYDDRADLVIPSMGGELYDDAVDELLDSYDSFTHIGALWGLCHLSTFEGLVGGMRDRQDEVYSIDVPLEAVASTHRSVYEEVVSGIATGWADGLRRLFGGDVVDRVADEDVEELLYGIDCGERYDGYLNATAVVGPDELDVDLVRRPSLQLSYTFRLDLSPEERDGLIRPSGFGEFS